MKLDANGVAVLHLLPGKYRVMVALPSEGGMTAGPQREITVLPGGPQTVSLRPK